MYSNLQVWTGQENSGSKPCNGPLTDTNDFPDPADECDFDEDQFLLVDGPPDGDPHAEVDFQNQNPLQANFQFDKENQPMNPRGSAQTAQKSLPAALHGTGDEEVSS